LRCTDLFDSTEVQWMMHTRQAHCVRCNQTFDIQEATGRKTHVLYCVRCGRHKRIAPSALKKYYRCNINSLLTPPSTARHSPRESVRPILSDENLDIRKYMYIVEHLAGSCVCGSFFRFSGKPRCPRCRSAVLRVGPSGESSSLVSFMPEKNKHGVAA
jgi:hypothetical protein